MAHTIATHHGGAGHTLNRGLDILTEGTEYADINNNSTQSLDAMVALGDPEAVGHPEDPAFEKQDRLTALTTEINDLHQRVAAREGQSAEALDCTQQELQNMSIASHQSQPPAPAEPFREVLCQYTDTMHSTQKQSNPTNSFMQDIPAFNENDSTKLEDWLLDIETAADLTNETKTRLTKARFDVQTSHRNDLFK